MEVYVVQAREDEETQVPVAAYDNYAAAYAHASEVDGGEVHGFTIKSDYIPHYFVYVTYQRVAERTSAIRVNKLNYDANTNYASPVNMRQFVIGADSSANYKATYATFVVNKNMLPDCWEIHMRQYLDAISERAKTLLRECRNINVARDHIKKTIQQDIEAYFKAQKGET